ncbi:hypothetical protein GCM10009569_10460 [Arthrobacter russicus]
MVAMIAAVFLAVAGAVSLALPARAAEIPGAVKTVTVTPDNPGRYDEITVDATWAVPDTAQPGDTFSLTLPAELDSLVSGFEIRNSAGELVANAVVQNGVVTFTLTDFVSTHKNVSGTAKLTTKLNRELEPGKPYALTFGNEAEVTITPGEGRPVDRTSSQKYGFWIDANGDPSSTPTDRIRWTVESPKGAFDRISFEDTVGTGMELECGSVGMNLSETFRANDEVQTWGPALARDVEFTASCAGQTLTASRPVESSADAPAVPEGQVLRLVYDTKVIDASASSYKNTALVTVDGTTKSVVTDFRRSTASGDGQGDEDSHTTPPVVPPTTEPPVTTAAPLTTSVPVEPSTSAATTQEELANTGANGLLVPAVAGGLAVLAGAGMLLMRRRSH